MIATVTFKFTRDELSRIGKMIGVEVPGSRDVTLFIKQLVNERLGIGCAVCHCAAEAHENGACTMCNNNCQEAA